MREETINEQRYFKSYVYIRVKYKKITLKRNIKRIVLISFKNVRSIEKCKGEEIKIHLFKNNNIF